MSIEKPGRINSTLAEKYNTSSVEKALSGRKTLTYSETKKTLIRLANSSQDKEESWVYALLADVCSMSFHICKRHVNYAPLCDFGEKKSFGIEEVTAEICELLSEIVPKVKDDLLRARLSDVVSMRKRGSYGNSFVSCALKAYFAIDFYDPLTWRVEGENRWRRAIDLARSVKAGNEGAEYVRRITEVALHELNIYGKIDPEKILDIASLVVSCGLYGTDNANTVEQAIKCAYDNFAGESACLGRDACSNLLITMYRHLNDQEKVNQALSLKGDGWRKDGLFWLSEKNDKVMAAFRFEEAEKAYMAIPSKAWPRFGVSEKLKACKRLKRDGFAHWSANLKRIKGPEIDIKNQISAIKKWMNVDEVNLALARFMLIYRFDTKEISDFVDAFRKTNVLSSLFSSRQIATEGRMEATGDLSVIQTTAFWMQHIVAAFIYPAYRELRKFVISRQEFEVIAKSISSILRNRQHTVAGAWWLGYCGDFRIAATILVPQIEFLVSQTLVKADVNVIFTKPGSMTETYMALSTLLEQPQTKECLGESLHKELKMVFGPAPYLNLRNNMMHGLIDDPSGECFYPFDLYIWWLSMRLMLVEDVFSDRKKGK